MISRGSWTSARAIAVRCCSPPESWAGICVGLRRQTDEREDAVDRRPDLAPRRPGDIERERHVLPDRLVREELEVLEDDPDLASHLGDLAARQPGEVLAIEDDRAAGRELVADEQLDERRLAGAGRPDEEDEVTLRDHEVDLAQGEFPVGVLLRHVVQDEDVPLLGGLFGRPAKDPMAHRSHGRRRWRCWGEGHETAPRRGLPATDVAGEGGWTPSAGTARGATRARGYHRTEGPANVTGVRPGPRTMVRSGGVWCGWGATPRRP